MTHRVENPHGCFVTWEQA